MSPVLALARSAIGCVKGVHEDVTQEIRSFIGVLEGVIIPNLGTFLQHLSFWLRLQARKAVTFVKTHRTAILIGVSTLVVTILACTVPVLIIQAVGFGPNGIVAESWAAKYQSAYLGGYILKGSVFASMQSIGALGCLSTSAYAAIVACGIAAGSAVAWFKLRLGV